MKTAKKKGNGYSLIEILITVAVASSLVAGAVFTFTSLQAPIRTSALNSRLSSLNQAVSAYRLSGGSLDGIRDPNAVISKLKSTASNGSKIAALRGTNIDHRLRLILAAGGESEVIFWDTDKKIFRTASPSQLPEGTVAIAAIALDATTREPDTTEERSMSLSLAQEEKWVWDYLDRPAARPEPRTPETTNVAIVPPEEPLAESKLLPPVLSLPPGTYGLDRFPLTLEVMDSNPLGVSELLSFRDSGSWGRTSIFELLPGSMVTAYNRSLSPDTHSDSDAVQGIYSANQVKLIPGDSLPSRMSYLDLGGPLASGTVVIPSAASSGALNLLNASLIPDRWENHEVFRMFWTLNGSDPQASPAGRIGGNDSFTNGYPGDPVPLSLANFSSGTLQVRYFAESRNRNIVFSSDTIRKDITRSVIPLEAPLITPESSSLTGYAPVTLTMPLQSGQTPANVRIYYRTDGQDPGGTLGEPAAGATLYTGPFFPPSNLGPVITITARAYPPAGYKDWFTTSALSSKTYFQAYADRNIFAVQNVDRNIYTVEARTSATTILTSAAPFNPYAIALDPVKAFIYYVEGAGNGWRLGRYDIVADAHTVLGSLASGQTYNATRQPENLAFYNGALYYIADNTDDLIRVTPGASGITASVKVADVTLNTVAFSEVGDVTMDESGTMYFCASGKDYCRFNMNTLSGYAVVGETERDYDAIATYEGAFYGADTGSDEIRRLVASTGTTLSKKKTAPARKFADFASPSPIVPPQPSSSLWAIFDRADGPHLYEIRNYRSPLVSAAVDYGVLYYLDGTTPKALHASGVSDIRCLCITSGGIAWFARNTTTRVAGKDYPRPLFSLDLSKLRLGDKLHATFAGDLTAGLKLVAGSIDPDDEITGLTISPSGHLYGVLREGSSTGSGSEDYLFKLNQTTTQLTGPSLGVSSVGRLISAAGKSARTEDLCFSPDGSLYAADATTNSVYRINPQTGSVLSAFSVEGQGDFHGLAVDPADYRLIACSASGGNIAALMDIAGGSGNDTPLLQMAVLFGLPATEAMAFFQGAFLPAGVTPDLYASDGSPTIYGIDFDTGATIPVTRAPWPVRALAHNHTTRSIYYLRNDSTTMSLGSFDTATGNHTSRGLLNAGSFSYRPTELPDNLCYFGGSLWYIPPHSDDLVRVELDASGNVARQSVALRLTHGSMKFDLVGDIAVDAQGYAYFTAVRHDGLRFCRFRLPLLNGFTVLEGPASPGVTADTTNYTEKWLDALAFRTPNASGARPLYGTWSSEPTALKIVQTTTGSSEPDKLTQPALSIIDFSDYHPGAMGVTEPAIQPALAISDLKPAYTYADVGGSFLPGSVAAPPTARWPQLILANGNEIPVTRQSSDWFRLFWTLDGQNPKTTATAFKAPDFSGGMPPVPVDVSLTRWGARSQLSIRALAVSQQAGKVDDSETLIAEVPIDRMELREPVFVESVDTTGRRHVAISPDVNAGDCPPGTRIYYTLNGEDPGVTVDAAGNDQPASGTLYTGPIEVIASTLIIDGLVVKARAFPPLNAQQWFNASAMNYYDVPRGLEGGHMDIDTAHLIYPFRKGATDGHVHEYDKKYNVVGESFFAFKNRTLENLTTRVSSDQKFKIIVSNTELSPGGRLVINKAYDSLDSGTYIKVTDYDNTAVRDLPVYSLSGLPGTTKLTQLGLYFETNVIAAGGLIGTVTGAVRSNIPGAKGEYRNGALTVQLVKVNPDGTDAFTVNPTISSGGHGPASSGLLWETTFFYHHSGGAYGN